MPTQRYGHIKVSWIFILILSSYLFCFSQDTRSSTSSSSLPIISESIYLTHQILQGVEDFLNCSLSHRKPILYSLSIESQSDQPFLKIQTSGGTFLLSSVWNLQEYLPIWKDALKNQSIQTQPRNDTLSSLSQWINETLTFSEQEIAKEGIRISNLLQKDPFSSYLHEQAGWLYLLLVIQDFAGRFSDPSLELCRASVHLILSLLSSNSPTIPASMRLASYVLQSYGGLPGLVIPALERDTEVLSLFPEWVLLLRIYATKNWNLVRNPQLPLLRWVWLRTLLESTEGRASLEVTESLRKIPNGLGESAVWHRILLEDPPTRKYLLPDITQFIQREGIEATLMWMLYYPNLSQPIELISTLNQTEVLFVQQVSGVGPLFYVIPWGIWARRYQRHLCHILTYTLGPQMSDRRFMNLKYYPFVLLQQRRSARGLDRISLIQAIHLFRQNPHEINDINHIHLYRLIQESICFSEPSPFEPRREISFSSLHHSPPSPLGDYPKIDDWVVFVPNPSQRFSPTLTPIGTAYRLPIRLTISDPIPNYLFKLWQKFNPWEPVLFSRYFYQEPSATPTDLTQWQKETLHPLPYHLPSIRTVFSFIPPTTLESIPTLEALAHLSPDGWRTLLFLHLYHHQIHQASQAWENCGKSKLPLSTKLNAVLSFLSTYTKEEQLRYFQTFEWPQTYLPLSIQARMLEETKQLEPAEKIWIDLQQRYVTELPLLAFYIRQSRIHGYPPSWDNIIKIFRNILELPILSVDQRNQALELAKTLIFPAGLRSISSVPKDWIPLYGLKIINYTPHLAHLGIQPNWILIGFRGTVLEDEFQFLYLRMTTFETDPVSFSFFTEDGIRHMLLPPTTLDAPVQLARWHYIKHPRDPKNRWEKNKNTLILWSPDWSSLPQDPSFFSDIETVDIRYSLPPNWSSYIKFCNRVKTLRLWYCQLSQFPDLSYWATSLEILDLTGNHLQTLPQTFSVLQRLHTLILDENLFEEIPSILGTLPFLSTLSMNRNRIILSHLPPGFSTLKELSLNQNRITALPNTFKDLSQLQHLYLKSNQIQKIPSANLFPKNLRRLDLGYNRLRELPDDFHQLSSLEILSLEGNIFLFVPESLHQLPHLSGLNLSNNMLDTLDLGSLPLNLQILAIAANRFRDLPSSLVTYPRLKKIMIDKEDFPTEAIQRWQQRFPHIQIQLLPD